MDLIELIQEIFLVVMILGRHRFCLNGVITKGNFTKPNQNLSVLAFNVYFYSYSYSWSSSKNSKLIEGVKTESSSARVAELETRLNKVKSMDIKSMPRTEEK